MANTFTALYFHVVFSTKNREPWLHAEIIEKMWSYLGGICKAHQISAIQIGGISDHVHLLLGIPPTLGLSDVVRRLKGESSKWLSSTHRDMAGFAWQSGYGAFTIGKSQLANTVRYIQGQHEHHKRVSFEDEYRKFLKVHAIESDERFIFG